MRGFHKSHNCSYRELYQLTRASACHLEPEQSTLQSTHVKYTRERCIVFKLSKFVGTSGLVSSDFKLTTVEQNIEWQTNHQFIAGGGKFVQFLQCFVSGWQIVQTSPCKGCCWLETSLLLCPLNCLHSVAQLCTTLHSQKSISWTPPGVEESHSR